MTSNCVDIWTKALSVIKENLNEQTYTTWFKPIIPVNFENKKLTVQIPSHFFYEFIETHYSDLINKSLQQIIGDEAQLLYSVVVNNKNEILNGHLATNSVLPQNLPIAKDPSFESHLNERYTFSNFVEGSNNQFARAASLAVANSPGKTTFNPLVIYGGVGLGKTHLIQAIGNAIKVKDRKKRILYVSSERFTVEFIDAIQNNRPKEFSNNYRNVDILLMDDIQFFTTKERTQEEFFHTFNTLYQSGRQIVLTSDRPPKELKGIEERLISRFQWGLVVDIQPPDLETRTAILQKKAEENHLTLPQEIIDLFATNITSNIRELEGSLIRLLAKSSLQGKDINLELAKDVLKDLSLGSKRSLTIEEIQRLVCDHFKIPEDLIRAKNRKKEVALARQISMYLAKKMTPHSLKTIGLHFGGRDHSTVIHAIQTIDEIRKADKKIQEDLSILERKIELASL
ncbi:MAG: chromosomal replication initiator protein DnaA [candidate division KSB1 bacterium]|nr:chromosomal replication initiator protein DnaA [candidate division KSB1 bacterium]MDZ7340956.1 chromosomal replication initiator protein DnaA [candidate division KSB1 bacterium]